MSAPHQKSDSMVGQTLRHYRIETKLGAGGMGIVYRARDTRLDRSIAIKVLPVAASYDAERKGRLAQEARAASALNHPNIITIYDIGSETSGSERVDFIAMEYVAGKTLDRLIGRKGLKLQEALKYAIQIADALAAAHATGIVHRDLKPANVMITGQGLVKVLDFGLAKLTEPEKADAFAQTESVHLQTEAGTIVGTVAYMSPEQAEAKELDARTDIFSFGTVLYEMLTGRRAFPGDSKLSVLATILHKDPPPVHEFAEDTPRELEKIIGRCLQKDPQQRWQTMTDVKLALTDLLDDLEAGRLGDAAVPRPPIRKRWLWPAAAALLLLASGGTYLAMRARNPEPPAYTRLTFRRGDVTSARFAPLGQTIVYSAEWDGAPNEIYSTIPGNRESRSLGLPKSKLLSLSASGEMAILLGGGTQGTLARVALAGGNPRQMLENVIDADWGPDGDKICVLRTVGGKVRLEYPVGKVLYETDGRQPVGPRVSPKGDAIAFFEYDTAIGDYFVSVVDVNDGSKRRLSRGWRGVGYLAWSPKGDEVWFSATRLGEDTALRAVTMAGRERIVAQVPNWICIRDISRDGRLLMSVVNLRIATAFRSTEESAERDLSWLDTSFVHDLSSDGKQLLFVEMSYGEGRNPSIYLRKTDGSPAVLLGYGNRSALSPDGQSVVAIRSDAGQSQLFILPTGAGEPKYLTTKGMRYESADWYPDGHGILFTASEQGRPVRTYMQDARGGAPRPITPEGIRASEVTPDEKSVVVRRAGRFYLYPIDGGEPRPIAAAEDGERALRWSADGKYLFLQRVAADGRSLQFIRVNIVTGAKQVWKEAGPADPVGVAIVNSAITPDGSAYAYSYSRDLSNLYLLKGVK